MRKVDLSVEVKRLVAISKSKLIRENIQQEKEDVSATLKLKEEARASLKSDILNSKYTDSFAESSFKEDSKNKKDVLIPAFEEQARMAQSNSDLAQTLIDTFCAMQLNHMRLINRLEYEIAKIRERSENPKKINEEEIILSEEAQERISSELNLRLGKLDGLRNLIDASSFDIINAIIQKATSDSKARLSVAKSEYLKESLATAKPEKGFSFEKLLDELALESLEKEIKELKVRKKLLDTDPDELASDILKLNDNNNQPEALDAFNKLVLLSKGTSFGIIPKKLSRFITVPVAQITLSHLNNKRKAEEGKLLYLQKNGEHKLSEVARMVSSISACLYLINEAELVKEKIQEQKSVAEVNNDLKLAASLRKNSGEIETIIQTLKQSTSEYYLAVGRSLDYVSDNLSAQSLQEYLIGQTSVSISQMESGIKSPITSSSIDEIIQNIGAKSMLIGQYYELPANQSDIIETLTGGEELSIIPTLDGEQYDLNAPQTVVDINAPIAADITTMDPNSFGDILPTIEDQPIVMVAQETDSESSGKLLESEVTPELSKALEIQTVEATEQNPKSIERIQMPFVEARNETYSSRTGNFSPLNMAIDQTPKGETPEALKPIQVATAGKLENQIEETETTDTAASYSGNVENVFPLRIGREPVKRSVDLFGQRLAPYSKITGSKLVTITGALGAMAYRAISKKYNFPDGAETIGGLRVK